MMTVFAQAANSSGALVAGVAAALLGAPQALLLGSGLCILIVMLYWISYNYCISFGKSGVIPPVIAGWTPNVVFILIAIYFIRRRGVIS